MSTDLNTDYRIRVKVFVDFWNFQRLTNSLDSAFKIGLMQLRRSPTRA